MHLPSNFLISSCSLVNKIWYRSTRTVLRNNRKCVVPISSYQAYQKIQELEQVCAEIEQDGRVVPFNGLTIQGCIHLDPKWQELQPDQLAVYKKITRLMRLKHLEVEVSQIAPLCPLQDEILAWIISGHCSQLRSLNIENPIFLAELFLSETTLEFPHLEIITIPELPLFGGPEECIKQMIAAAPNLKRIIVQDRDVLHYLPTDKYNLLVKIPFHVKTAEQEQLFRKVAAAKPKLTEIVIIPPSAALSDYDDNEDEDSVDAAVQQRSDDMLELMLQNCHASLESIRVNGLLNPLGGVSFPPLINLKKIKMEKWLWTPTGIEKFWRDISSIDYRSRMPSLEEIEIIDTARVFRPSDSDEFQDEEKRKWPTSSTGPLVPPDCSSNVHKLTLHVLYQKLNFLPLKSLAPNVTSLDVKIRYNSSEFEVDILPFPDIWKFWPQLVELKVDVGKAIADRNHDADFCGIHEEEAEVLRGKDEAYLQNVHIVPAKPSILTMTKLRKLTLGLDVWARRYSVDSPPTFLSRVTQILAFRRMNHADFVVSITPMLQAH